jgi:hypothetical protein
MKQTMTKTIKEEFEKEFVHDKSLLGIGNVHATCESLWSWFDQKLKQEYQRGALTQASMDAKLLKEQREKMRKKIEERMNIEKQRAEIAKTEKEYKEGKYIGLRYALDILKTLEKE